MKTLTSGLLALSFVTALIVTSSSQAEFYQVNRSFTQGTSTATLVGTVEVPLGHYVIQNTTPNPFAAVDLTMTVNATSYHLTYPITDSIYGTGQFIIDATPTTLTFSARGDATNPADLAFYGIPFPNTPRYAIGSNGDPAFETAIFGEGQGQVIADVGFPVFFGTVIPEPSSLILFVVAMLGLALRLRRDKKLMHAGKREALTSPFIFHEP